MSDNDKPLSEDEAMAKALQDPALAKVIAEQLLREKMESVAAEAKAAAPSAPEPSSAPAEPVAEPEVPAEPEPPVARYVPPPPGLEPTYAEEGEFDYADPDPAATQALAAGAAGAETMRLRNKERKRKSKLTRALMAALLFHLVLGVLFAIWTVIPRMRDEPEIVAEVIEAPRQVNPKMKKKNIVKQLKQTSSASLAAPLSKLVRAKANTRLSMPKVTRPNRGLLGLGEGDFGDGLYGNGNGDGQGMGSGAAFFGATGGGAGSLCFVLDYSASMKGDQRSLVHKEMKKALKSLVEGTNYQIVMFAGPAWFAGTKIQGASKTQTLTDPQGKKITFSTPGSAAGFKPQGGKLFTGKWLTVSQKNVNKSISHVTSTPYPFGTQWTMPLKTALSLNPPPEVIFFMSDGNANEDAKALGRMARAKGTVVHTFAMQTSKGATMFRDLAKNSGGEFRIVLNNGKSIKGEDYFANPGKFNLK